MNNIIKKRTVLVSGNFNIVHPGHLRLFRFAKEYGDKLIVVVESDRLAGNSAHLNESLRLEGIQSISWVDEALIADISISEVIKKIRPDVVVKGKEHESRFNAEVEALKSYGGELVFSSGEALFSSLELIKKEIKDSQTKTIILPEIYMRRHKITNKRLLELLKKFSKVRVLVIGDLIVDEYIDCQPLGMSQEDPTIVVTPIESNLFVGGAGIVSAHAAGMGAIVKFITVTGLDATRDFAEKELKKTGVDSELIEDDTRPTTLKKRFRSKGKTLLRVNYLHQDAISLKLQNNFYEKVVESINKIDLIVFSDFNYGCLPQSLVDRIIKLANSRHIMLVADSQSSSQYGDISRFKNMNLITPTEHEARIALRNNVDGLVVLSENLKICSNATNILLKMGEEGLLIHAAANKEQWLTDRIGALNSIPRDVAGAGDSLLITSALTLATGGNIWEAACLGSLAAAIQVGRFGNTPLSKAEIFAELAH